MDLDDGARVILAITLHRNLRVSNRHPVGSRAFSSKMTFKLCFSTFVTAVLFRLTAKVKNAMLHAGDDNFIREFQRRRKRMLCYFASSMTLIILALVLLQLPDQTTSFFIIGGRHLRALATSQFVVAVVFALIGLNQYRCPSCNEIVRGHDRYYLGVLVDPKKCPRCGKHLK